MTMSTAPKKRNKRKAESPQEAKIKSKTAKLLEETPAVSSTDGTPCKHAADVLSEKYAYPFEVLFCEHCGTLFDLSSTGTLMSCQMCKHETRLGEVQADKKLKKKFIQKT